MGDELLLVLLGGLALFLKQDEADPGKADHQPLYGNPGRRRHHSTDPVIFSYNGYDRRLCKLRSYVT